MFAQVLVAELVAVDETQVLGVARVPCLLAPPAPAVLARALARARADEPASTSADAGGRSWCAVVSRAHVDADKEVALAANILNVLAQVVCAFKTREFLSSDKYDQTTGEALDF